jgi:CDP-glucose 4,6-dehydratase
MKSTALNSPFESFYKGKSVLVTGHTGFKGGWLATWLKALGAKVIGYALPPENDTPSLFKAAHVDRDMVSIMGDIRDFPSLVGAFKTHAPQIVFHMAAQSLVRYSYAEPVETYDTNVMGTVQVLEAVRQTPSIQVVVIITSDKCYENREWAYAYRENDPMGGYDPYSASKGAAELITASYRNSYFHPDHFDRHGVHLASVRAGNVIGGGDWAVDRLIPDCVRALVKGQRIPVRNPKAVRPWQFVLEPLSGYLSLAHRMWKGPESYDGAWNFGPIAGGNASVQWVVTRLIEEWGSGDWAHIPGPLTAGQHEATFLKLDCTKAATQLRWIPVLSLAHSIRETISWYRGYYSDKDFDVPALMTSQIKAYVKKARHSGLHWAREYSDPVSPG